MQVQVPPVCSLVAGFVTAADTINPGTINFTNTSTGYSSTDSVQWTFGDGFTSSLFNTTHTFPATG
jgi:hypothetical protein